MGKLMGEDTLLEQNKDSRICVVLTSSGISMTDEGYKGCIQMMNDCYPEGKNEHNLFLAGKDMNDIAKLSGIMKKRPYLYLVISQNEGTSDEALRLIPSGPDFTPDLAEVADEAVENGTFQSSWELFDAFLKAIEESKQ